MRFLYKINPSYDGFHPGRLPYRLEEDKYIDLSWRRYLDEVTKGDEVWIYFKESSRNPGGIYAKGRVYTISRENELVRLRVFRYKQDGMVASEEESRRAAEITATRFRQVFHFPDERGPVPDCNLFTTADSCTGHRCESCSVWQQLPMIKAEQLASPPYLSLDGALYIPAYWTIPSRCYLGSMSIAKEFHRTTDVLSALKFGNAKVAYPLARGIYEAMINRGIDLEFDCIIPIPLSPDKARKNEIHRTKVLARELGALLEVPVKETLSLTGPISKRRFLNEGGTKAQFRNKYRALLNVNESVHRYERILLLDDVCTHGNTLGVACDALLEESPRLEIVAVVAAQMIVVDVLLDETAVLAGTRG